GGTLCAPLKEGMDAHVTARPRCMQSFSWWCLGRSLAEQFSDVVEYGVDDRHGQQRQEKRKTHPPHHKYGDRTSLLGSWPGRDQEWNHTGNERNGRHENRAQPVAVSLENRLVAR